MPNTCLLAASALAAIIGVAVYLPMQRSAMLFEGPAKVENFGMDRCTRVSGPAFCDDVRIQRNLNLGFLACDPSLPYRNFAANVHDESKVEEDGALWMYNLSKPGSPAEKLSIKGFSGPFHPSGITFAPTSEDGTPARIVILAVNHVPFETPRVEVLYYYPARKSLVYKKTIKSENFMTANKIAATESIYVHQYDDTPSFFVSNDHGYNTTDWKREYEEKYNLPASSIVFYNARADVAQESAWRLQLPSGIVEGDEANSFWVAQAKAGSVDMYRSHTLSAEHQEEKVLAVDTKERLTVLWPGMLNEESLNPQMFNHGIDYDKSTKTLVTVSHTKWNDYVRLARAKAGKEEEAETPGKEKSSTPTTTGFVVSRANQYPVRVGQTRPKPLKDIVFDPEEVPRRYKMQRFIEPLISHDGSDFGSPSAIALVGDRVLVSSHFEEGFLDCNIAPLP